MVQYLCKFLPHLSDISKPLRDLTLQDAEWSWEEPQPSTFERLKTAVASTPVLRYYNLQEEVTLQCDASQSGLGAALLQNGQPVAYASRALTPTETSYAQLEKELLVIVFACEKFDAYIFGRDVVKVESDHKSLESISRKELCLAPKCLQRMLLRLQKYSLDVCYVKGEKMYLAGTLSRAYLPEVNLCDFIRELEEVDHKATLPVSDQRWTQLIHASADDPALKQLRTVIQNGWPDRKSNVPECLRPYFDLHDELIVQGELIFKGPRLVIPTCLRKELMAVAHSTHIGIEGCLRRARECLFWPRMGTELKEFILKCNVCLAHRTSQTREPLLPHEVIARPWAKFGADLCDLHGRTLLVMSGYYSNYVEVARLTSVTTQSVVRELKTVFSHFGIPEVLVTDSGPQFSSAEFQEFATSWSFDHVTSSPRYPQSNGKAENAVKTVKRLFSKCREDGQSEFLALLDWCNTPTEGMGTSPAQRLMGRRCRTLLPMSESLLQPQFPMEDDLIALRGRKQRQERYYNRHCKQLKPIDRGDTVCVKVPGEKVWTSATCVGLAGPRSYLVKAGGAIYRRNQRDLISTGEASIQDVTNVSDSPQSRFGDASPAQAARTQNGTPESAAPPSPVAPVPVVPLASAESPVSTKPVSPPAVSTKHVSPPAVSAKPVSPPTCVLCRSQRERRPPNRFQDFVV